MQPEIQCLLAVWVVAYGQLPPSIRVRPAGRSWMTGFQTYASLVFARIRHRSLQCIYARERLTITAMPYRAMVCSRAQMEVLRGHNLPTQLLLTFAAESSVMLQAMSMSEPAEASSVLQMEELTGPILRHLASAASRYQILRSAQRAECT